MVEEVAPPAPVAEAPKRGFTLFQVAMLVISVGVIGYMVLLYPDIQACSQIQDLRDSGDVLGAKALYNQKAGNVVVPALQFNQSIGVP